MATSGLLLKTSPTSPATYGAPIIPSAAKAAVPQCGRLEAASLSAAAVRSRGTKAAAFPSSSRRSPSQQQRRRTAVTVAACPAEQRKEDATWNFAMGAFLSGNAFKVIAGLQNFDHDNVAAIVAAAEKGGATHVDIACEPALVKLACAITSCPVCVSAVEPDAFVGAVAAGAHMVEIGNFDSFYKEGRVFSAHEVLDLTRATRQLLPLVALSVTVPHTLPLDEQVRLAEALEEAGADIIQTEGGTSAEPASPGVLGLIEKAAPTLAAAYSISKAVNVPLMCASGLSSVTAPMAVAAGAAGVGVGSAINKLNDEVAMIAAVRSIADSLGLPSRDASYGSRGSVPVLAARRA